MMSTLLISETFPPKTGGSGRWFWEIYRRQPIDQYIIAAGLDPHQQAFDLTQELRVTRMPLGFSDLGMFSLRGWKGYWAALRGLLQLVREHNVDQVHAGRCLPEGWLAWLLKQRHGTPYICYVHGEEVKLPGSGESHGVMSSRQLRWITRNVMNEAAFLIANSHNTERILLDEWDIPPERIRLLYPGADCNRFKPAPRDLAVRNALGWGERPVVLTVGRLQKRKGHDRMIAALLQILQRVPDVLYAIVGAGAEQPALEKMTADLQLGDSVLFHGEIDDEAMLSCYQQCDLFVLPNRQIGSDIEGFGMVLVEAQACGKSVIAGASGGTAETMQIPATGRVVPCEEPGPLAELVTSWLLDAPLRERMGLAARNWAATHFDWTALSQQAAALFASASRRAVKAAPAALRAKVGDLPIP
ncbi:MAG TPA: glycosyltransferase family 4 protein [Gemmataceae bacterium]|nr:glycosyltransferase family 4 protein [Gemmataceae bacterium]